MKKSFFTLLIISVLSAGMVTAQTTLTRISDAKKDSANGAPLYEGYNVNFKGIVSSYNVGNGKTAVEFFMYDNTGPMCVYGGAYVPKMGDSINIQGIVGFYEGQTEIENGTVTRIDSGNTVIAPLVMNGKDLVEANEDEIVEYKNMVLEPGSTWGPAKSSSSNFSAFAISTDGKDTIEIWVEKGDSCFALASPGADTFDIIGAVEQYITTPPYLGYGVGGGYEVAPRRPEDIQLINHATKTTTGISNSKNTINGLEVYPVPAPGELNIRADEDITNIAIYDVTGKLMMQKLNAGNNTSLNISSLNSGIYLVRTESGNSRQISKIIKN